MGSKTGRNAPCPCGSGKKYKHCHLGQPDDPEQRVPAGDDGTEELPLPSWTRFLPYGVGIAGTAGSIALLVTSGLQAALAAGAATAFAVVAWFLFSNPPPPRNDAGDPAGLNFGRKD